MIEKRKTNAILFCDNFHFKGGAIVDESCPASGRVYEATYDSSHGVYTVSVKNDNNFITYVFEEISGNNDVWEWEFTKIDKENIDSLLILEEDIDLVYKFINGSESKITSLDEIINTKNEIYDEEIDEDWDSDKFVEELMGMIRQDKNRLNDSVKAMNVIIDRDKHMAIVLQNLLIYLAKTYDDKYQASPIDTMGMLMSESGKDYSICNSVKYLSRYLTKGFEKSENPQDLQKAIHYCLFELKRKSINGSTSKLK